MAYKIVYNDNYLMHFNGNHSSKNGQFVSGDGDKDGVVDDHHNYARNKNKGMKGDRSYKEGTALKGNTHYKGFTTSKVYKTKKGKDVVYVSPNNLMRNGYWADAKTGKKSISRTLFRSAPLESRGKEYGKSMFQYGVAATTAAALEAGKKAYKNYYTIEWDE